MTVRPPLVLSILAVWLGTGAVPPGARSAEAEATSAAPGGEAPLRIRKIEAPENLLQDWPFDQVRRVPMQPEEFERLVGAIRASAPGIRRSAVGIAAARYQARMVEGRLVGTASLEIFHSATSDVLLPLEPCGVAVEEAVWETADQETAVLGFGDERKLQVLVKQAGTLGFNWSLAGAGDTPAAVDFQLELPRSPSTQLVLDLPEEMTPRVEHGLVFRQAGDGDSTGDWPARGQWRIELGGRHHCRLRVVSTDESARRRRLTRVRQSLVYDFSLHGVEVSAELQLDVRDEPLRQVTVGLDAGLQLADARYGGSAVPWAVVSPGSEGQATSVVLELPDSSDGIGRTLWLRALGKPQIGRRWRLPRIRPEGMFWQEGTATLSVPSPLVLEQLVPIQGRQSSPLSALGSRETVEVQYFTADAAVEVVLARPQARLEVDCATDVRLSGGEISAHVGAEFRVTDGQLFQLQPEVAPHWVVDSVELVPADALGDWSLPEKQNGSGRELTVRLARALSPDLPVRLLINARRLRSPLGRTLKVDELTPLSFPLAAGGQRLMAVRPGESYQLKLAGDEALSRREPRGLDADLLSLFAEPPRRLVFDSDAKAAALRISLEPQKPGYSATIRVEATVSDASLVESYVLRCVPETARVDRVLVRFSRGRTAAMRWTLGGEEEEPLTARLVAPGPRPGAAAAEGQTWEVRLRPPRSVPFEIRTSQTTSLRGPEPVSLVCLPEAAAQRGTLVVYASGSSAVRVQNNRLRPIPTATVPPEQYNKARATYSYDPARDAAPSSEPPLSVVCEQDEIAPPSAWVWSCPLQSRCQADGTVQHLATCRLENAGRGRLRLMLPPTSDPKSVRGVWVDGARAAFHPATEEAGECLDVELPNGRRFPVVSIQFSTRGRPLGLVDSIGPPQLEVDVPVLTRHWTVWLPPGYESRDADPRWQLRREPHLTWRQRLFGPLGRSAADAPFDPLLPDDWLRLAARSGVAGPGSARRAAEDKAHRFIDQLAKRPTNAATTAEAGGLDWGTLLTVESLQAILADRSEGDQQLALLVDLEALTRLGLTPRTPVPPVSPKETSVQGDALLRGAGLAVLVSSDAVVVTSGSSVALDRSQLSPRDGGALWWICPGRLADRVARAVAGESDHGLVRVTTWQQRLVAPGMPWMGRQAIEFKPGDTIGWTAYEMEVPDDVPVALRVVRRDALLAFQWGVFLAVVALTSWLVIDRPVVLTILAGLFGAAALLLPEAYVDVASGAVLGTLFTLGFRLIRRRREPGDSAADSGGVEDPPSSGRAATGAGAVAFALAMTLVPSASARADQPGSTPSQASAAFHNVFVPVDEQGRPTGGKYQVPAELYNELYRREAALTQQPKGWLLGPVDYRGALAWQGAPERLVLNELKATGDLYVFGPGTRVRLALAGEGAELLPSGVLLDGRAIAWHWDEEGGELAFDVAGQQGQYRLELALRPAVKSDDTHDFFDLRIPPAAPSRLELTLPRDAPDIEVPTAVGSVSRGGDRSALLADLGPADRLTVRWPSSPGRGVAGPPVEVEELLWLKVRPGSVVLDARFKFQVLAGRLSEVRLAADPRLRLESYGGSIARVDTTLGRPQTIRLGLSPPVSDQAVVEASFLLRETSAVGTIEAPRLKVLDARTTRRWMAVWVAPEVFLGPQQEGADQLAKVGLAEFEAAWGQTEVQPLFVHDLADGEAAWSIPARPCDPRTTISQRLALGFDREEVEVHFDAQLTTEAGYHLQYRIDAPADLEVDEVSLLEDSVERVQRWSRVTDGSMTVFLTGPVAGQQSLSIRGRLPITKRSGMPLPVVRVDGPEPQPCQIQLFRKPAVQIKVGQPEGLVETEVPVVDESTAPLGRLVKAFDVDGRTSVRASVAVVPNRPKVRAGQVTTLRFDGEYWEAEVSYHIRAERPAVDELRIEVPPQWSGPYRVDPPEAAQTMDETHRQLVVRPSRAITDEYTVTILSPLTLALGDPVCVPKIVLQAAETEEHLLVLPRQWQLQPAAWETQGLSEVELPEDLDASAVARESFVAYHVDAEEYQAVLRPLAGVAQVHLADVSLAWQADGTCHGVAIFDLEPAGRSQCGLRLPAGYRLVHATVAEVSSTPVPVGENVWQLPLSPGAFPQRIEVLFWGKLPAPLPDGRRAFPAPTLQGLPVRRTVWTISGPAHYGPGRPHGLNAVSPLEHAHLRLENIRSMVELAAEMTSDQPDEAIHWHRIWAARLAISIAAYRREIGREHGADLAPDAGDDLDSLERLPPQVAGLLEAGDVRESASATIPWTDKPAAVWLGAPDRPRSITRAVTDEPADAITLSYGRLESGWLSGGVLGSIGLAALILLTVVGMVRGLFSVLVRRWPYALGVASGLAWWLWLWPSVLGWGIVLISLAASLRSGWKRSRPSASVIVPFGPVEQ